MAVQTDFSPIVKGDTPVLQNYFTQKATPDNPLGIFKLDTVSAYVMFMRNKGTGELRQCTGQWNVQDAAKGLAYFHLSSDDTGTVGAFVAYPVLTTPDGPRTFGEQSLVIKDIP